jgi:enoyl-CoA hydratase/carnithine racemase
VAVRYCKELIQGARTQPVNSLLAAERERFVDLFELEDTLEGVNAFLEKRPPQWTRR